MTSEPKSQHCAKLAWTTPELIDTDQGSDAILFANGGPNGDGAPGSAAYNLTS